MLVVSAATPSTKFQTALVGTAHIVPPKVTSNFSGIKMLVGTASAYVYTEEQISVVWAADIAFADGVNVGAILVDASEEVVIIIIDPLSVVAEVELELLLESIVELSEEVIEEERVVSSELVFVLELKIVDDLLPVTDDVVTTSVMAAVVDVVKLVYVEVSLLTADDDVVRPELVEESVAMLVTTEEYDELVVEVVISDVSEVAIDKYLLCVDEDEVKEDT
jgi:hypothetical protein